MEANIVKVLLIFCLLQICQPQDATPEGIGTNFCLVGGVEDNLSCPESELGQCFNRSLLCNGVNDCGDATNGSDEGDNPSLSSLQCKLDEHSCVGGFANKISVC